MDASHEQRMVRVEELLDKVLASWANPVNIIVGPGDRLVVVLAADVEDGYMEILTEALAGLLGDRFIIVSGGDVSAIGTVRAVETVVDIPTAQFNSAGYDLTKANDL